MVLAVAGLVSLALVLPLPVHGQTAPAAAAAASFPADGWWSGFGDAQLDTLIAEGLKGATDLRVAEARFRSATAAVGGARAALLPTIGATAQAGVAKQSYNYLFSHG